MTAELSDEAPAVPTGGQSCHDPIGEHRQPPADDEAPAPGEDLTGRRLGRFTISKVLGAGGMSTLYEAVDTRLDRPVALKIMHPFLASDHDFRSRFLDEARHVAAIDHPHVVPLYDVDEADEHLYIAMRLVHGTDLARVVRSGSLALPRAMSLLDQLGQALDAVHAQGLVHLDVKPSNVLVATRSDNSEHLYLADFGLTRRSGDIAHRTAEGYFVGSPSYAAPEHIDNRPLNSGADIYSLACLVFTCVTGHPPYRGDVDDVMHGHLHATRPSLASSFLDAHPAGQLHPGSAQGGLDIGENSDRVIRRALAGEPTQRPPSASAFLTEFRRAMAVDAQPTRTTAATTTGARTQQRPERAADLRVRAPASPADLGPFVGGPTEEQRLAMRIAAAVGAALLFAVLLAVFLQ